MYFRYGTFGLNGSLVMQDGLCHTMLATRAPRLEPSWRRLGERSCHSDMHGDANAIACADWCKQEKAHNHW